MRTVLIHSGGLDSTTLLYQLRAEDHEVLALSIDYGQRHRKEIEFAQRTAERLGIRHETADLAGLAHLLSGSSLTSPDVVVPQGHYEEETMKATVVPNRNMILLAVAAGWALAENCEAVSYAAHSGDHAIYPDCREEFAEALDKAIGLADWKQVRLHRPFVGMSKADIVARGEALGVPFAETWSCYQGGAVHCGRCGTCVERREAFYLAGVADPTPYAEDAPSVDVMAANQWRLP